MFSDPREPWITRGILISVASLFELCKAIKVEFRGDGNYGKKSWSVPGTKASAIGTNNDGTREYVVDADFLEICISEIRDANVQLSQAVEYMRNFKDKVSVSNLVSRLIYFRKYPDVRSRIQDESLEDSIGDFTFDFQELQELSSLLLVSYRNRESHKKLREGSDMAFTYYHHAMLSRFLCLVNNCSDYCKSRGWWTSAPFGDNEANSLPMMHEHEEAFRQHTHDVFTGIGRPPLCNSPVELCTNDEGRPGILQPDDPVATDACIPASKADLYELVDIVRENHQESGSHIAWLDERLSSLVESAVEEAKDSLLEPWMNKNLDSVLNLISLSLSSQNDGAGTSSSSLAQWGLNPSQINAANASSPSGDNGLLARSRLERQPVVSGHRQEILRKLRLLRNEIRDSLHKLNPRFEYYHCVLQSDIVAPAVRVGVCSYDELKRTDEFIIRIVRNNKSFMLAMQEDMFKERIDQILSQNHQ